MAVELPKLEGMFVPIDSGKITTPIQKDMNTLSDQTKMWRANVLVNHLVRVTDPSGRREIELVAGNAGSTIVIRDTWSLSFPAGSDYEILAVNLMQALRDVFAAGVDIDLPAEFDELKASLMAALEAAIDTGVATGGSNTTIVDTGKSWAVNMWADATFEVTIGTTHHLGLVVSNTANTITFAALAGAAVVVAGCEYSLKRPVTLADISDRAARLLGVIDSLTKWGGTDLTGRNISADLQALTDDSIKGLLKSIGYDATESLIARIGAIADAAVAAGAAGSNSAKLRRLTTDLGALLVLFAVVATATNTKVSVGSSDTTILAANASRKFAVIVNDSDETIYLSLSATAVQGEGIRLNAAGGAYEINAMNRYTGEISGICTSGGKYVTVSEG